ncbi:hypothetical protein EDEG_01869 [Edhazardia aedis USNM 41457]|uniref:Uncharacterized protein n=1 Tax=Edhazardia aedis (strain USNM 41457) TaxID=1003232 RepID=J8ZVZ2_EDHAE|nr:hypothetical protein EDEG_01869 [Edhazardia aedis USNM 41457]|eukprot:EJW03843.1 hypothetical protein EDEG_01869 [Edhazardia aedis USNM 41457]
MGSAGSAGIISSPGKYIKVEQPKVVAGVLAQQETAPVAKVVSGVSSQQEPIPVAKVEPVARPAAKAVAVAVQPQHRAATVAISSSPKAAPANIQFVDVSQPEPPKTVKIAPAPVKKQPVYNIKPAKEVVEVPVAPVQENYVPAPTQEYIEVQSEMPYIAKEAKQVVQAAEPQYVMETEGAQPQEYELITDGSRQETGSAAVEYYTNQEVPQEAQAVYVSGDTSQGGYISVDSQDEQGVAYIEQQPTEYIEHQSAEYMPVEEEIEPVATQYVEARPKPVLVPVEEPKQVLVEEPKVLKTNYDTKKDENSDEICLMCNGNSSVSPALMANPSKEGCGCSPDE